MNVDLERRLSDITARAGITLPPAPPGREERPWPVVLLTGFGAWLAAVPLLAFFGLLLGDWMRDGPVPYVVAILLLGGAVRVLRRSALPLFLEQLAVPALLTGALLLGYRFYRDLPDRTAALMVVAMALALAACLPRAWLRMLLGAAAAGFTAFALMPPGHRHVSPFTGSLWWALHGLLAIGLAALRAQPWLPARLAAGVEAVLSGWLLTLLAGLALLAGMTFLVGGALGLGAFGFGGGPAFTDALAGVSGLLAVAAGAWLAWTWPDLRRPAFAVVTLVAAGLAATLPTLGAVLVVLAVCVGSGRWRLAGAAAVAGVWIIGAFYYRLDWSLSTKAAGVAVAALLLGMAAWGLRPSPLGPVPRLPGRRLQWGWPGVLVLAAVILCLAVANVAIGQKERLIAQGEPLRVALAPADPRSLMQGDYMRLAFQLPSEVNALSVDAPAPAVVFQRDGRGVSRAVRVEPQGTAAAPLAAGEQRVVLVRKSGRWTLVTDAWFFREGDAARFEAARFGEFRVQDDGRALLVGLLDETLRPIAP